MNTEKTIGVKQVIRLEWMQKTADMLIAGRSEKDIRAELEEYLKDKSGGGGTLYRADKTKSIAVSLLMNAWASPRKELKALRDAALTYLKDKPEDALVCHWLMYAGAYPFLFNICGVFGALFSNSKEPILKNQIMSRIYEIYGERSTVERCSRYAIRTFIVWGFLKDNGKTGIYEKNEPKPINSPFLGGLLLESALRSLPEQKSSLQSLLASPGFFPFALPQMSGSRIAQENERLQLEHLEEEYLKVKN